jgi:D-sedoheptulose 7-phosphate isomerase
MEPWSEYLTAFASGLRDLAVTDKEGRTLAPADAFRRWVQMTREVHDRARYVYFIGNGGSAMMAGHLAADACKNGGLRALALNDVSLLTATANDLAFDQVFALPLARLAVTGDLLISTSSSGNSPNIVKALDTARSMSLHIVTLSGKGADNRSRTSGDLNFYVPSQRYGKVECAHQVILHYWLDQYMNLHGSGAL